MDSRNEQEIRRLTSILTASKLVHIYGAGLNPERPAHTAVAELKNRGWAVAPIHPRDGGATIDGFPIRPALDQGILPEVVVLFLAPERARAVVRNLIMRIEKENFPLIWFQLGAEDDVSREALESMGVDYVEHDCIVRFTERHNLSCEQSILPQKWCLQIASENGDGCSEWSVHSSDTASLPVPTQALEWVGSMNDLLHSEHTIPRYIRSLKSEQEGLHELAVGLSGQVESQGR